MKFFFIIINFENVFHYVCVPGYLKGFYRERRSLEKEEIVMNENLKYGLFFLGGAALGALGAVAVSRGKLDLKPFATELLSRGLDARDALLTKAETVRESVEDMVAEAKAASDQRKVQDQA